MTQEKEQLDRRNFIKKAGITAGAAGVAVVAASGTAKATESVAAAKTGAGYQETDHVRTYYELAAF